MNGLVKCNMCIDQCTCSIQNVIDGNFCVVFCHPESLFIKENNRIWVIVRRNIVVVYLD
jgi:hypothetical protein